MVADEVCVAAGHLTFIDRNGLKPGKNCESFADLHRRIWLNGLTQGQSIGPFCPIRANPRSPIFVLLYPLDKAQYFLAPGMECHHVVVVLYVDDFVLST